MCNAYSMVLSKENDYFNESNSHEDIIRKYNLREEFGGKIQIVRAEFVPPNRDYLADVADWKAVIDQDLLPDWADEAINDRIRRIGERIVREHTITDGSRTVTEGTWIAYGTAHVTVNAGGRCWARDTAHVTVKAGGWCWAYGTANVTVKAGGRCWAHGKANVTVEDGGR